MASTPNFSRVDIKTLFVSSIPSIVFSRVAFSSIASLSPIERESLTSNRALTKPSSAYLWAFSRSFDVRLLRFSISACERKSLSQLSFADCCASKS